jgi:uncharacterized delta-60 repeat protein
MPTPVPTLPTRTPLTHVQQSRYRLRWFGLALLLLMIFLAVPAFASPRSTSPTGVDCITTTEFFDNSNSGEYSYAYDVAIQPDGKLVAVGDSMSSFAIARYTHDCYTTDITFSGDGRRVVRFPNTTVSVAMAVRVQPDGKLMVAGYASRGEPNSIYEVALARLNSNGTLDSSFDEDGMRMVSFVPGGYINGMSFQDDGTLVVVGGVNNGSGTLSDFAVARYRGTGDLDTSFDGDGFAITDLGTSWEGASAAATQPDGKLVVVGSTVITSSGQGSLIALARYNLDGSLDASFDSDGRATTNLEDCDCVGDEGATAVAISPDGKIVVGSNASLSDPSGTSDFTVLRYQTNGSLDTSFGGGDGIVSTDVNNAFQSVSDLLIQPDGKIVVTGPSAPSGGSGDFVVLRYTSAGALDPTFDGDGVVVADEANDNGFALAQQNDGRFVVVGALDYGSDSYFALVRVREGEPPPPPSSVTLQVLSAPITVPLGGSATITWQITNTASVNHNNVHYGPTTCPYQSNNLSCYPTETTNQPSGNGNYSATIPNITQRTYLRVHATTPDGGSSVTHEYVIVPVPTPAMAGDLDLSFDHDGTLISHRDNVDDQARDIAIQSDGKLVVATTMMTNTEYGDTLFGVTRYLPDGRLDTSFGTGGSGWANVGERDSVEAVLIQPDGKIVLAGYWERYFSRPDYGEVALVRYNPDGTLDTSFGGDGIVITEFYGTYGGQGYVGAYGYDVVLQPDGKLVVAAKTYDLYQRPMLALVRYNSNGSLDTNFGDGGRAVAHELVIVNPPSLVLQSDGKLVVATSSETETGHDITVARFNTNGTLDATFGTSGVVRSDVNGYSYDQALDIASQADGKLVVVGSSWFSIQTSDFTLVRYNANGSLDTTFGGDGIITTDFTGDVDIADAVLVQPDGKIVVAGRSLDASGSQLALARYNTDGSLDHSFGAQGGGRVVTDRFGNGAVSLARQADGKLVAAGNTADYNSLTPYDIALARYLGDSAATVTVEILSYPSSIPYGGSATITWRVQGASYFGHNNVHYGPNSCPDQGADLSCYPNDTVNKPGAPGVYSTTITNITRKIFFRAHASAGGSNAAASREYFITPGSPTTQTPTTTPTTTPSATPTATQTATPTATLENTSTPTVTPTATQTPTATPTQGPTLHQVFVPLLRR